MCSLAKRVMRKAAPNLGRWCRRGWPAAPSADTKLVSKASWTPPHNGSPFAIFRNDLEASVFSQRGLHRQVAESNGPDGVPS